MSNIQILSLSLGPLKRSVNLNKLHSFSVSFRLLKHFFLNNHFLFNLKFCLRQVSSQIIRFHCTFPCAIGRSSGTHMPEKCWISFEWTKIETCKELAGRLNKRAYLEANRTRQFSQLVGCQERATETTLAKRFYYSDLDDQEGGGCRIPIVSDPEAIKA